MVKGAGLFLPFDSHKPASVSKATLGLKKKIEALLGAFVFAERKALLRNALLHLQPEDYDPSKINASLGAIPVRYTFADRYSDLASAWLALSLLELGRAPRDSAFIETRGDSFHLDSGTAAALNRFRDHLETGLLRLMQSQRPDWGYAMLVGLARLAAVETSLQSGRLKVLNTLPDDARPIPGARATDAEFLKDVISLSEARLLSAIEDFKATPNERSYSLLEIAANLSYESQQAYLEKRPLRLHSGNLAPLSAAPIALEVQPQIDRSGWARKLAGLQNYRNAYALRLKERYRYDLLTRNCVTEIFANIDAALSSKATPNKLESALLNTAPVAESSMRLGGYVGWKGLNTIPFFSSWTVEQNYRLAGAWDMPSYRQIRLQDAYRQNNAFKVYIQESNIFTSTFYRWHSGDSAFLFFTDDAVWPRPLYGTMNALAGASQSVAGLFALPFDGGQTLLAGLRGFLISLPELLFINIRKGSFPNLIMIENRKLAGS